MSEEDKKETKEKEQENSDESIKDRNKRERTEFIKSQNDVAERMEKANEDHKELLEIERENDSIKLRGGKSEAGTEPNKPKFSDEETASRARIKAVADASGSAWAKNYE